VLLSLTVRITVNVPADEYAWLIVEPVPIDPSPKLQLKEYGAVPPLAEALNAIC